MVSSTNTSLQREALNEHSVLDVQIAAVDLVVIVYDALGRQFIARRQRLCCRPDRLPEAARW